MAPRVLVLVNGHLVAEGATAGIRQLISERPRRVLVTADDAPRAGTRADVERGGRRRAARRRRDRGRDRRRRRLSRELPAAAGRTESLLRRIEPVGDDLESVYAYLHERAAGAGAMILPVYRLTLRALLAAAAHDHAGAGGAGAGRDLADLRAGASREAATRSTSTRGIVQQLFMPTVAALVALVFGVSAFGDEREDGTILYLVATPQPRLGLVVAKVAAAWTASLALLVPSLVLSGLLGLGIGRVAAPDRLAAAGRGAGQPGLLRGLVLAVAEDAAAGGDRRHLHPALGRVDRDLCGVGRQALDLGLRQRLRCARAAPVGSAGGGPGAIRSWCWWRWSCWRHWAPPAAWPAPSYRRSGTGEQPAAEQAGHDGDQHRQQQHPEGELDRAEHAEHQDREDQKQKPDHALRIPGSGGR